MCVPQDVRRKNRVAIFLAVMVLAGMVAASARAQQEAAPQPADASASPQNVKGILDLDIEQLGKVDVRSAAPAMNLEVTSVSKQESTVANRRPPSMSLPAR